MDSSNNASASQEVAAPVDEAAPEADTTPVVDNKPIPADLLEKTAAEVSTTFTQAPATIVTETTNEAEGKEESSAANEEEEESSGHVVMIEEELEAPANESSSQPSTNDGSNNNAAMFNRFSSWRQKANENATAIWKKQREQVQATVAANPGLFTRKQPNQSAKETKEGAEDDDDEEGVHHVSSGESGESMDSQFDSSRSESGSEDNIKNNADNEGGGSASNETTFADRPRVAALQWAASNMVENVQVQAGYFRGRYNKDGADDQSTSTADKPQTPKKEPFSTQTSRILQSPQALHMQELQKKIAPHEYVMLLGRGMLGVNLKQPYLKHQGVYVDFLVEGGAADESHVIHVGDLLVSVGDASTLKETIMTVPKAIANAKRPVHLILATPGAVSNPIRINYVDIAVALLHKYTKNEMKEVVGGDDEDADVDDSSKDEEDSPAMELVQPASFDVENDKKTGDEETTSVTISIPKYDDSSPQAFVCPTAPPVVIREAFESQVAKRSNDFRFSTEELLSASSDHEDFRNALEHAFLLVATDGRRFPFLARHLSFMQADAQPTDLQSSALLTLYLEMANYSDLYKVTPSARRKAIAQRIATKFILPTRVGNDLVPPVFDFHCLVSDKTVRALETALASEDIPSNLFHEFQKAAVAQLSAKPFISFMIGSECARMRAFLRNTAPFVNLPLGTIFESVVKGDNPYTQNYVAYVLIFLLCQTEKEGVGECDEVFEPGGDRVQEAASGICATFFLQRKLLPLCERAKAGEIDASMVDVLFEAFEHLWEVFLSPGIGALEHSALTSETEDLLEEIRSILLHLQSKARLIREDDIPSRKALASELIGERLVSLLKEISYECMYDYAVNFHPKFREHKFHEWLCSELAKAQDPNDITEKKFHIPAGCVKRLLRKADFPPGVSEHKPASLSGPDEGALAPPHSTMNAECALVFGTSVGLDMLSSASVAGDSGIRRYACQSLGSEEAIDFAALQPEEIPPTLEGYASAPLSRVKPFGKFSNRTSHDGWEISLVNFCVPRADASTTDGRSSSLFGVSLVFQKSKAKLSVSPVRNELVVTSNTAINVTEKEGSLTREIPVKSECKVFNEKLAGKTWTERVSQEVQERDSSITVGLALVSSRNVVFAMRETLTQLLNSFKTQRKDDDDISCHGLVDLLGNFANQEVEMNTLKCILEYHMITASKPWLERPLSAQHDEYQQMAGRQLIRSLPPIPLALLFITALMEQKIVLSSSRRSILMAATTALTELLRPLKWCHLLVPRVPAALAGDLLQYPAPFILGMPSEDDGIMDLIRELPEDVTLVDLDVGRVILAPSFAHTSELGRGTPNNAETSKALRSQALYLAQSLGGVFGVSTDPDTWSCDVVYAGATSTTPFDNLKTVCHSFVEELLSGTTASCYWVEESDNGSGSSATVLFDEDRFFHIKNLRESNDFEPLFRTLDRSSDLALALDDFDLIIEVFLRCQCLNYYISTTCKKKMVFAA